MRSAFVDSTVRSMDLEQKVGQLWMANFCGDDTFEGIRETLGRYYFGGAMISVNYHVFKRDRTKIPNGVSTVKTPAELTTWVNTIQEIACQETGAPLLIGTDQEGGSDRSLLCRNGYTIVPSQMALGASANSESNTETAARIVGRELRSSGFNMIYGPILDLDVNSGNPEIGIRSFSSDPETVARLGRVYMDAIAAEGVGTCPKHFPGRGRGIADAHFALETITASEEQLKESDLFPFVENRHTPALMVGHTVYSALDPDYPASLSHRIVTEILRKQIGFEGVILTDELTMWAIAHHYTVPDACVLALQAGADMFFLKAPEYFPATKDRICDAVKEGRLDERHIDQSVRRVLRLKESLHIKTEFNGPPSSKATTSVWSSQHAAAAQELAEKTLVVTRGDCGGPHSRDKRVLAVIPRDITVIQANDGITTHEALPRALKEHFNSVEHIVIDQEIIDLQVFEVEITARRTDIVVLLVSSVHLPPSISEILERLQNNQKQGFQQTVTTLVANRPSLTDEIGSVCSTVLCSYCPGIPQYRAFARWLSKKGNTSLTEQDAE